MSSTKFAGRVNVGEKLGAPSRNSQQGLAEGCPRPSQDLTKAEDGQERLIESPYLLGGRVTDKVP